jgi:hypothetical protein
MPGSVLKLTKIIDAKRNINIICGEFTSMSLSLTKISLLLLPWFLLLAVCLFFNWQQNNWVQSGAILLVFYFTGSFGVLLYRFFLSDQMQ